MELKSLHCIALHCDHFDAVCKYDVNRDKNCIGCNENSNCKNLCAKLHILETMAIHLMLTKTDFCLCDFISSLRYELSFFLGIHDRV